MNLNTEKWIDFQIEKLFNVEAGKYYYSDEYSEGDTPYCSASAENNGVAKKIDLTADFEGNKIIIGKVGCSAFYEPMPFCATSDVNVLTARFDMTPAIGLFIATVINKNENYRWNYGRQCRVGNTKKITIKLPAVMRDDGCYVKDQDQKYSKHGYIPDFAFMEKYIKSLHHKHITTKNITLQDKKICIECWRPFKLSALFDIVLSKGDIKVDDVNVGSVALVSSGETNNGVVGFIDEYGDGKADIFDKNILTLDMFCNAFYQNEKFYAVSHGRVNILKPQFHVNKYIGLFIVTLLKKEKYKFSYGRAVYSNVANDIELKLPCLMKNGKYIIDKNHKYSDEGYIPDWQWMENYIKELPYSDRI